MSSQRRAHNLNKFLPVLLGAMAVFLLSLAARAATITGYSDLVSRLAVTVPADHEIKFVSPTGVESSGDTMRVTFESDFDLSSITVGDIDLAIDTSVPTNDCGGAFTNKILASSADTSPTWGVAAVGQVLTFMPPTDAGVGEIPANTCVRILVGQNAAFGGAGTHQIGNPSGAFAHIVSIGGGFGDTGLAYVLNNDSDQVTVSASIAPAGGGGGGGGGGQPNPPVINNVRTLNLTETEVDVLWDTDISSSSTVNYGLTVAYGDNISTPGNTFNHSVHLSGLTAGTTYHYRVRSTDNLGQETVSGDFTFTTPDTSGPVLSNVVAVLITGTSARITWDTNEDADSRVDYGVNALYGSNDTSASMVNAHAIDLVGLTPNTTYHYEVTSKDASGNSVSSQDFTFTTADTIPPTISNIFVDAITETSARVNWTTNELADSTVRYGMSDAYGSTITVANRVANHQIILNLLASGTLYHFSVSSADAMANGATSTDETFTTLPDTTPPANVSNLASTPADARNTLTWTNPADADFAGVRIQRSTIGYPANPNEGITIYDGAGNSTVDAGLANGTKYYYTAFAYDNSGNFASGAVADGTPFGPPAGPVCGNLACEAPETIASCPADCSAIPPPAPFCGNAVCDPGENTASCPADCPAPPPTPVSPNPVNRELIRLFALNRVLELHQGVDGDYRILPTRSLTFFIPMTALPRPAVSMMLEFDSDRYLFMRTMQSVPEDGYVADVSAPATIGRAIATVTVTFDDGTSDVIKIGVRVEPLGLLTQSQDGQQVPLSGATITLQKRAGEWIDWDAIPYRQMNPTETGAEGVFAFMAPPGRYRLVVKKPGYRTHESAAFDLATEVVNPKIELIALPPSFTDVIIPGASVTENVANVANALVAQGAYITKIFTNEVINDPRVRSTTYVLVPIAAAVTTAVVATAVQATSLASYLYFLLTQPLLLIARRKRKGFGTVYNALTKLPLDLASVRLFRTGTNRLVRTVVTDKYGRYAFIVEQGEYRIEITKPGYAFPSRYLLGKKEDAQFIDLYHGERIVVNDEGAAITANIPLDPIEHVKTNRRLLLEEFGRHVQNVLAFSSVLLTLIAALLYRHLYLYILAAGQLLLYLLFRRLARPKRPKNWGIIYDERTKKPIPFAVARIVETQYNRTLESSVADSKGRYNFLVGSSQYYVTVEKPGYEPAKTQDIDLSAAGKDDEIVSRDIPMREKKPE